MSGAGTLYIAVKGDTKELISALNAAKNATISYGKQAKQDIDPVGKSLDALKDKVVGLGSAYLGLQGLKTVIGIADQYSLLDSKLKLVTTSTSEFAKVNTELFDISQRTGTSFATNAATYSNLGLALKDLKIPSSELLGIFDTLNKSIVVAGASTSEASAFLLQFKQGMASGKFAGDEFKSMMENNSYFGLQLAKALNTDIDGLYKMKTAGELTTDTLRKAFPAMAEQINRDFDGIQKTIGRAMTELSNAFNDIVANANKTTGGTSSVASSISSLASTITENKEAISNVFIGMIKGASVAVEGVANVANSVRGLAIVAASKDKTIFDWISSGPEDVKAWVKEIDNGTAFLKDRLVEITEQIRSSRGEDKSNIHALLAEKKAIRERITEIQNSTVAEDEAIAKSIAGVEKRLGVEAKATNSFIDSWQGKRDISITMAKEIADAEDKYYTDQEAKAKKAYKESKKIVHLKATDAFDGLEIQKKVLHESLKEEEDAYKKVEAILKAKEADTEQAYNKMTGLIKSSKKTEVEVWQEAIDTELEEFERLSDGSKEYTDAMTEYRAIKNKELLDRIKRNEKDSLTAMDEMWLDFAHGAQSNFSEFFSGVLKGEFDSIGEAFKSLCDAMVNSFINAVSNMAAQQLTTALFGSAATGSKGPSTTGLLTDLATSVDWSGIFGSSSGMDSTWGSGGDYTFADGGVLQGGSGQKDDLFMGKVGGKNVFAKGGEYFMPPEQTAKYYPILEGMRTGNDMYFAGGGSTTRRVSTSSSSSIQDVISFVQQLATAQQQALVTAESVRIYNEAINKNSQEAKDATAQAEAVSAAVSAETQAKGKSTEAATISGRAFGVVDSKLGQVAVTAGLAATGLPGVAIGLGLMGANMLGLDVSLSNIASGLIGLASAAVNATAQISSALSFANSAVESFDSSYNEQGFSGYTDGDLYGESTDPGAYGDSSGGFGENNGTTGSADSDGNGFNGEGPDAAGWATGGIHKGGWRIVGERGPELEFTPPSRIYSNSDTNSILAGLQNKNQQQVINLTIPVSVGNEPLTTLMVRVADGVATVRQKQNVTGGAYRL